MQHYVHGGDIYSARNRINGEILDFSANINPLGMPANVKKAVEQGISASHVYPDPFCRELVWAIAQHEQVEAQQVICGNGAADLIFRLALAIKPQKALILAPTFAEYQQALATVGCEICHYFLKKEQDFAVTKDFLERVTEDMEVIFLCNPNNPTGQVINPDLLYKIIAKCQNLGIWLVLDECFNDFLTEPQKYSMVSHLANFSRLFVLKAFTKIYAMPGLRLGYGLSANLELLDKMHACGQPWSVSVPAQAGGIQALQEVDYIQATQKVICEERQYLISELQNLGFQVWGSEANYIFFQGPVGLDQSLEKQGILIRSCENYLGLDASFFRIAIKLHDDNQRLILGLQQLK